MKIAFLGNCQLMQIGWLLKEFFRLNNLNFTVVWYEPIFALGDKNAPIIPLFDALSSAEKIYGLYHDGHWNALSTQSLSKYFSIKLVPNLESIASFPQMNYFSEGGMNYNFYTVDFRMLDMYLSGVSVKDAPYEYSSVEIPADVLQRSINNTAEKYRARFSSGQVVFDYSAEYLRAMAQEPLPYFVHNHPGNSQLQWLANQILMDIGCPLLINMQNLDSILFDTYVPALNGQDNQRYRLRSMEIGLATACKAYYAFFSSYDRSFLEKELDLSVYRNMRDLII